jgi:hypothetical protein
LRKEFLLVEHANPIDAQSEGRSRDAAESEIPAAASQVSQVRNCLEKLDASLRWQSLAKNKKAKSPSDIEITVNPSALVILQPGQAQHKLT